MIQPSVSANYSQANSLQFIFFYQNMILYQTIPSDGPPLQVPPPEHAGQTHHQQAQNFLL